MSKEKREKRCKNSQELSILLMRMRGESGAKRLNDVHTTVGFLSDLVFQETGDYAGDDDTIIDVLLEAGYRRSKKRQDA